MKIEGKNSVRELLKTGKTIDKVLVANGMRDAESKMLVSVIKSAGVKVSFADKSILDKESETRRHQGFIAYVSDYKYVELGDILNAVKDKEDAFIVILDGVEDPHNLGSILRVCECAGVHGVIIPKNRAVGVNETVIKTSAGAAQHMLVSRVSNLSNVVADLKRAGLWVYAADMDGQDIYTTDLKGKICLVVGGEGKGVGRLLKENCDGVVALPLKGKVNSLNASVACGVVVYEALRQRLKG